MLFRVIYKIYIYYLVTYYEYQQIPQEFVKVRSLKNFHEPNMIKSKSFSLTSL